MVSVELFEVRMSTISGDDPGGDGGGGTGMVSVELS